MTRRPRRRVVWCGVDCWVLMAGRVEGCCILGRAAESTQELRLVDRLDAQRFGLVKLAARLLTRHHGIGPLAHAAGHPAARPLDELDGPRARERRQGARENQGLAGE